MRVMGRKDQIPCLVASLALAVVFLAGIRLVELAVLVGVGQQRQLAALVAVVVLLPQGLPET